MKIKYVAMGTIAAITGFTVYSGYVIGRTFYDYNLNHDGCKFIKEPVKVKSKKRK